MSSRHPALRNSYAEKAGITEANVNPQQLAMGIEVELEHTKNREIAKQIAIDHLAEIPDYYSRLKLMEKCAEKYWTAKRKKEAFNNPEKLPRLTKAMLTCSSNNTKL